jgi:hypothetical protein
MTVTPMGNLSVALRGNLNDFHAPLSDRLRPVTIEHFVKQVGNSVEPLSIPRWSARAALGSAELEGLAREFSDLRDHGAPVDAERLVATFLKAAHVRAVKRGAAEEKGAKMGHTAP